VSPRPANHAPTHGARNLSKPRCGARGELQQHANQWRLLLLVLLVPQLTHIGQSADDSSRLPLVPLSNEEFNKRLNEMFKLPEPE
jgi:hypothetical protein